MPTDSTPARPTRRRVIQGAVAGVGVVAGTNIVAPTVANAYPWSRTLSQGMSGNDVRELQIRVAGFAAASPSRTFIAIDGQFGPATHNAVRRFQSAWGLTVDGIAGPQTQNQLNWLEGSGNSTRHFNFSEFHSKDGSGFSGGRVNASTVTENVRRLMWKLEGLRRKAGNNPVTINSGFRSISHNAAVGGASNSQHTYGIAADIVVRNRSVSQVMEIAKTSGFSGIIRYSWGTHVDSRVQYPYGAQSWYWTA
jgi:zinc D-Ala-D-Ala carboxypeptidase